jgi:hypothetical protein
VREIVITIAAHAVVEGMLKPDGSPELAEKLGLPPGRARETVELLDESPSIGEDWFEYLRRARTERESAGPTVDPGRRSTMRSTPDARRKQSSEPVRLSNRHAKMSVRPCQTSRLVARAWDARRAQSMFRNGLAGSAFIWRATCDLASVA